MPQRIPWPLMRPKIQTQSEGGQDFPPWPCMREKLKLIDGQQMVMCQWRERKKRVKVFFLKF